MRGPLGVRIRDIDDTRPVNVTDKIRNSLVFHKTAFGGDVSLSCTLRVPRRTFEDLGPGDQIDVFDTRTGDTVWSGNLDNPGTTVSRTGEIYEIQAFGAAVKMQSKNMALGYVVTRQDIFSRSGNSVKRAQTTTDERRDGTPTLMIAVETGNDAKDYTYKGNVETAGLLPKTGNNKFDLYFVNGSDHARVWDGDTWTDQGPLVLTNFVGEYITRVFRNNNLQIGRIRADFDCGNNDTDYLVQLVSGSSLDDLNVGESKAASTAADFIGAHVGDGQFGGAADVAGFRVVRNNSRRMPTDHDWFEFWNLLVRQMLVGRRGTTITDGYDVNYIYAHQVIIDMIGRNMAPGINPDFVDVPDMTYPIDNLDWLDGITMGDAMEALLLFEPEMWWKAHDYSFEVGFWSDQEPRYVIGRPHLVTTPGEEFALCNRIVVNWVDRTGKEQTTTVKVDIDGLNYTRDAEPINLPEGMGSEANAQRAGEKALELLADPPRASTAIIRKPIRDQWQGIDVFPHEIEPGCHVREMETGDILRLTEVEYNDSEGAATLTLGDPVRTVDQYVARLHRRQRRRHRRR